MSLHVIPFMHRLLTDHMDFIVKAIHPSQVLNRVQFKPVDKLCLSELLGLLKISRSLLLKQLVPPLYLILYLPLFLPGLLSLQCLQFLHPDYMLRFLSLNSHS